MDILEKVKQTMLLTKDQKEKILNAKLDEDTIKMLEEFFDKYEEKEIELSNSIKGKMTNIMINLTKYIEEKNNIKLLKELEQLEKKLKKL